MSDVGKTNPRRRQSDATFSIVAEPSNCSSSAMALKLAELVVRFAVAVLERLDASDHAEAAPGDLVRARVPARCRSGRACRR